MTGAHAAFHCRFHSEARNCGYFKFQHSGKDAYNESGDQEFSESGMEEFIRAKLAIAMGRPRLMDEEKTANSELRGGELSSRPIRPRYMWSLFNQQRREVDIEVSLRNPLAAPVKHGKGDY